MSKELSPGESAPDGAMMLTDMVTIPEEIKKDIFLRFGRIEGTDDIYIERFVYKKSADDESSNMWCIEKVVEASLRLTYAWNELKHHYNGESTPLSERYMNLIRENCETFTRIRKQLFPVVRDFIEPLSPNHHRFYSDEEEEKYFEDYYMRRGKTKWEIMNMMDDKDDY